MNQVAITVFIGYPQQNDQTIELRFLQLIVSVQIKSGQQVFTGEKAVMHD